MPKVSVIVPNYNHADYLPERLESIFNQHFTDFEVILLDDHSTDHSAEILEKYAADKRVSHFIKNTRNSGSTFAQWEKGLAQARGEYIWIAESDDVAAPDFLSRMVHALETTSSVGIAFTSSVWVDAAGAEIHRPDHEAGHRRWSGRELMQSEFLQGPLIYNSSAAVFRRTLTAGVNFEELRTFRYTGDWLFWVQVAANAEVVRLDERLNFFRRHSGNVSFQAERDGLLLSEGFRVIRYIYAHYPVSFLNRQKNALRWARRIGPGKLPPGLPFEIKIYHRLFQILK